MCHYNLLKYVKTDYKPTTLDHIYVFSVLRGWRNFSILYFVNNIRNFSIFCFTKDQNDNGNNKAPQRPNGANHLTPIKQTSTFLLLRNLTIVNILYTLIRVYFRSYNTNVCWFFFNLYSFLWTVQFNSNIHQFMQFNIHTHYKSRYQLNKSKLKIRGSCI